MRLLEAKEVAGDMATTCLVRTSSMRRLHLHEGGAGEMTRPWGAGLLPPRLPWLLLLQMAISSSAGLAPIPAIVSPTWKANIYLCAPVPAWRADNCCRLTLRLSSTS